MMLSLVNRYYMMQELNSFISSDESKPIKKTDHEKCQSFFLLETG